MKKTYILDTNVLLNDPNCFFQFEDNDLIIPFIVLEELDNHKSRMDEVGKNARVVSRALDDFRSKGNLHEGVPLPNGGTLKITSISKEIIEQLPYAIIAVAHDLKFDKNAIIVSKDVNVRVKCDALGIAAEDYLSLRVATEQDKLYRGLINIDVSPEDIETFYKEGNLPLLGFEINETIYSNQFVILKSYDGKSAIGKIDNNNVVKKFIEVPNAFGLVPRNLEQKFSLNLLFDDNIKLVTMAGAAGCGKTLLAIAAGLAQTVESGKYSKLIVSRPIQPLGRDLGYLPGTMEEKMAPWIAPIMDNVQHLMNNQKSVNSRVKKDESYLSMLMTDKKIEIEAITYIRGRSIPNAFIIIDEAQNLSMHELKTIITRAGDNTKIVLTGDLQQIDVSQLDMYTNGLTYAIEKFKEYPIAGHMTLIKGERSDLASLAAKIL
jgi:PhoH-like ATPase